ncbi:MAG: NBR1-Ig-like domain-containing protein [Bacteroidota bacterium]
MNAKLALSLLVACLAVAQAACGAVLVPPATPDTGATLSVLLTMAAQTGTAVQSLPTATVTPGLPTASPFPIFPTSTPFVLPSPTSTRVVRCNAAAFVKDVTVADGSTISQGAAFTKIWRLRNVGTCAWTSAYDVVFFKGNQMSGRNAIALSGSVQPGQTIDIAVELAAPTTNGHYRGYWKLRDASNVLFGLGSDADTPFWVDINVYSAAVKAYDFVAKFCAAEWENNNSALPCPGTQGDDRGYVFRVASPRNEDGTSANTPGLITQPRLTNNGIIRGVYPAFQVRAGDHFRARVSCRYRSERCDVVFRLDFRSGGQTITLGTWREVYEGNWTNIDLDLSALAGRQGKFILVVEANGAPKEDEGLWIAPRIIR